MDRDPDPSPAGTVEIEGEHRAPLSYSVDAPSVETSAEKPIFIASLVSIGVAIVVFAVGWLLMASVADAQLITRAAQLIVVGSAVGLAAFLARGPYRKRMVVAAAGSAVTGILFALLVGALLGSARPTFVRLRAALNSAALPGDWQFTGREQASGSRLCNPGCQRVVRTYRGPVSDHMVRDAIETMLSDGWHLPSDTQIEFANEVIKSGVHVQILESNTPGEVTLSADGGDRR
jgi:hypothetical protein